MKVIEPNFFKEWQNPAQTEKQAYVNHLMYQNHCDDNTSEYYLAFPWASLIDHYITSKDPDISPFEDEIVEIFRPLDIQKEWTINTVCQHIYWEKLIPIWERLGVSRAFCCHLTNKSITSKIDFFSWPLYAVNRENIFRNIDLIQKGIEDKKHLCSLVGCISEPHYRSNIREKIYDIIKIKNSNDVFIEKNDQWFFQNDTFGTNKKRNSEGIQAYNKAISDSIFTLCPEGSGPNTIRLWEAMSVGSIPVLFENDWKFPPIREYEWSEISITIKQSETNNFIDILRSISREKIEAMQRNCVNAYHIFRTITCDYFLPNK